MRSALFALSPRIVAGTVLVALIVGAGLTYLGVRAVVDARLLSAQQAEERRVESANLALSKKLSALEDRLGQATRKREEAERELAGLSGQSGLLRGLLLTAQSKLHTLDEAQNTLSGQVGSIERQLVQSRQAVSSKQSRAARLQRALGRAESKLHEAQAERATLSARLARLQGEAAEARRHEDLYRQSLRRSARELKRAIAERDRLRLRLGEHREKYSERLLRKGRGSALAHRGRSALAHFKRVLASTGLDVERLLTDLKANRGEGGPFVAPPKGGKLPDQLTAKKLAVLHRVAKALPLSLPLHHFRMTSPFGMRRDPFNGRPAFHPGIDLAAPYGTPVYATAPGVVVYAGWDDGYGKLIKIDDGHGIATWYGHLHRYTVLTGEHVAAGTRIGYEGSTGRSTGPHVIYEVLVNGHPQNPMKFVALGRLVRATAR